MALFRTCAAADAEIDHALARSGVLAFGFRRALGTHGEQALADARDGALQALVAVPSRARTADAGVDFGASGLRQRATISIPVDSRKRASGWKPERISSRCFDKFTLLPPKSSRIARQNTLKTKWLEQEIQGRLWPFSCNAKSERTSKRFRLRLGREDSRTPGSQDSKHSPHSEELQ